MAANFIPLHNHFLSSLPFMAPPKQPTRGQQRVRSGLGLAFTSPIKRLDKRKTTTLVQPFGQAVKRHCLQSKLHDLLLRPRYRRENSPSTAPTPGPCEPDPLLTDEGLSMLDVLPGMDVDIPPPDLDSPPSTSRRIVPNEKAHNLYKKWGDVIPTLVDSLLSYIASSTGTIDQPLLSIQSTCRRISCVRSTSPVLCLFQDRKFIFVYLLSLLISVFVRLRYIQRRIMHMPKFPSSSRWAWPLSYRSYLSSHGSFDSSPGFLPRAVRTIV